VAIVYRVKQTRFACEFYFHHLQAHDLQPADASLSIISHPASRAGRFHNNFCSTGIPWRKRTPCMRTRRTQAMRLFAQRRESWLSPPGSARRRSNLLEWHRNRWLRNYAARCDCTHVKWKRGSARNDEWSAPRGLTCNLAAQASFFSLAAGRCNLGSLFLALRGPRAQQLTLSLITPN
jgi:hypothetical protein